jgi:hypothetical protein
MLIVKKSFGIDRLIDLERTVNSLNEQLHEMQGQLYGAKAKRLAVRIWQNVVNFKGRQEFMSGVCNPFARPNTKMVFHADPRA